jgi:hypothetical protein
MDLVKHVIWSLNQANTFQQRLPESIIHIHGMSGWKTRTFYNALCSLDRPIEYFEVGAWQGSTLCSALHGNPKVHATVIDNWSEFDGPYEQFITNVEMCGLKDRVVVFKEDFTNFNGYKRLCKPVDIYLYDGDHSVDSQRLAITNMWDALAEKAIVIVDDWNSPDVRKGTEEGFKAVDANIVERFEILYTHDGAHTPTVMACQEFWNGIGVFVIDKRIVTCSCNECECTQCSCRM